MIITAVAAFVLNIYGPLEDTLHSPCLHYEQASHLAEALTNPDVKLPAP